MMEWEIKLNDFVKFEQEQLHLKFLRLEQNTWLQCHYLMHAQNMFNMFECVKNGETSYNGYQFSDKSKELFLEWMQARQVLGMDLTFSHNPYHKITKDRAKQILNI